MTLDLYTQMLPWRVRVRRWWHSPTQWTFVAGLGLNGFAAALDRLGLIGLSGPALLIAIVIGNVVLHGLGATIHYQTTTIIGDSHEVAQTSGDLNDARH